VTEVGNISRLVKFHPDRINFQIFAHSVSSVQKETEYWSLHCVDEKRWWDSHRDGSTVCHTCMCVLTNSDKYFNGV